MGFLAPFWRLKSRFGGKSPFNAGRAFLEVEFIKEVELVNFGALCWKIVGIQSVGGVFSLVLAFDTCGDKLITPSPNTFKTLLECKKIREGIGGENHHIAQCKRISDNLGETEYVYYRKCLEKFVYAKTLLKRKGSNNDNQADQSTSTKLQRTTRASSQNAITVRSAGIFPSICMICNKKDIKVIEITSWLVSAYDSYSRVVKDR